MTRQRGWPAVITVTRQWGWTVVIAVTRQWGWPAVITVTKQWGWTAVIAVTRQWGWTAVTAVIRQSGWTAVIAVTRQRGWTTPEIQFRYPAEAKTLYNDAESDGKTVINGRSWTCIFRHLICVPNSVAGRGMDSIQKRSQYNDNTSSAALELTNEERKKGKK